MGKLHNYHDISKQVVELGKSNWLKITKHLIYENYKLFKSPPGYNFTDLHEQRSGKQQSFVTIDTNGSLGNSRKNPSLISNDRPLIALNVYRFLVIALSKV